MHSGSDSGTVTAELFSAVWQWGGQAERHNRVDSFANVPEHYKFSYSREISNFFMSTGKFKSNNLKISVTIKTSWQKNQ
jgi:hypothetical protein